MNKIFSCKTVPEVQDTPITLGITENFEKEKYEEIPKLEEICLTCQIIRPKRSKHCRFLNKCVLEYDHYCYFLSKTVGKGNRKVFFLGLLEHYLAVALFLYLAWAKIDAPIEKFEHISTYVVNLWINYLELDGLIKMMIAVSVVVWWYSLWYLFLESYSISYGLTINEVINRHRYRYLFVPYLAMDDTVRMQYKNPFTKGLLHNWVDFLVE